MGYRISDGGLSGLLTPYSENVQHKNTMKVLRDEITSLKDELLEVKHANRILAGRLNSLDPSHRSTNLDVSRYTSHV